MTPEHRLACEIMAECGKSPHEIVKSAGWDKAPALPEVVAIIKPQKARKILPPIRRGQQIEYKGITRSAREWMQINRLSKMVICYRRNAGWSLSAAYGKPVRKKKRQQQLFTEAA